MPDIRGSQVGDGFPGSDDFLESGLAGLGAVGANLDAGLLGLHSDEGAAMTMEVLLRHIEDWGGGLARIDGRVRLIEGLALPSDEIESRLSYYNSATAWIDIDPMLSVFGLNRIDLTNEEVVTPAVRAWPLACRPT